MWSATFRCSVLMVAALTSPLAAQSPAAPPTISVNSTGKVSARADLAIVFLSTRASAPLAVDALEQNERKVNEVRAKLVSLGCREEQIRFTGHKFSPPGQGVYYPGRERPTGYDVYNNLYVYLDGPELKDTARDGAQ